MERLETPLFVFEPTWSPKVGSRKLSIPAGHEMVALTSDWSLTFDTETTVEAAQSLRVGFAQIRKGGCAGQGDWRSSTDTSDDQDIAVVLDYADSAGQSPGDD